MRNPSFSLVKPKLFVHQNKFLIVGICWIMIHSAVLSVWFQLIWLCFIKGKIQACAYYYLYLSLSFTYPRVSLLKYMLNFKKRFLLLMCVCVSCLFRFIFVLYFVVIVCIRLFIFVLISHIKLILSSETENNIIRLISKCCLGFLLVRNGCWSSDHFPSGSERRLMLPKSPSSSLGPSRGPQLHHHHLQVSPELR